MYLKSCTYGFVITTGQNVITYCNDERNVTQLLSHYSYTIILNIYNTKCKNNNNNNITNRILYLLSPNRNEGI